jgi:RNA polymerase sigma factor (sigma-70 family)
MALGTLQKDAGMPDSTPIDRWPEDRILREASQGNEEAFGVFCERSLPSLYRYVRNQCRRRGIPEDLANDFCHEAVIRALDCIRACAAGAIRPFPVVSQAWLSKIAINAMHDWGRRERKFVLVSQIELEARQEPCPETTREYEEIIKFFNWLPSREREILELVFVGEKSIADAGAELNLSQANSYKVFQRALELLRDLLAQHGHMPQESQTD